MNKIYIISTTHLHTYKHTPGIKTNTRYKPQKNTKVLQPHNRGYGAHSVFVFSIRATLLHRIPTHIHTRIHTYIQRVTCTCIPRTPPYLTNSLNRKVKKGKKMFNIAYSSFAIPFPSRAALGDMWARIPFPRGNTRTARIQSWRSAP